MGTGWEVGSDEELHRRIRADDCADVSAIEDCTGGGDAALEGEQGVANGGNCGDEAGCGVHGGAAKVGAGEVLRVEGEGGTNGSRGVGRVGGSVEHAAGGGAIEQAGIEVGEAECGGEAAGEGAFAGRGRAIDGDDQVRQSRLQGPA